MELLLGLILIVILGIFFQFRHITKLLEDWYEAENIKEKKEFKEKEENDYIERMSR